MAKYNCPSPGTDIYILPALFSVPRRSNGMAVIAPKTKGEGSVEGALPLPRIKSKNKNNNSKNKIIIIIQIITILFKITVK